MNGRRLIGIISAAMAAACATGPSGPPPFDPVGTYDVSADLNGETLTGTMIIKAAGDGYTGELSTPMLPIPPSPINSVEVVDQSVTIEADGPEGLLLIELVVTDTGLEGTWSMGEGGGIFTATRSN